MLQSVCGVFRCFFSFCDNKERRERKGDARAGDRIRIEEQSRENEKRRKKQQERRRDRERHTAKKSREETRTKEKKGAQAREKIERARQERLLLSMGDNRERTAVSCFVQR